MFFGIYYYLCTSLDVNATIKSGSRMLDKKKKGGVILQEVDTPVGEILLGAFDNFVIGSVISIGLKTTIESNGC